MVSIPCLHERLLRQESSPDEKESRKTATRCSPNSHQHSKKLRADTSCSEDNDSQRSEGASTDLKNTLKEFETVSSDRIHEYLKKTFSFKELKNDAWKHPLFTDKTFNAGQTFVTTKKKHVLKTEGKTPIQLIHEYSQKELGKETTVTFNKIDVDGIADLFTEVVINGLKYGVAKGDNYRAAKHTASAITLDILNPKLFSKSADVPSDLYKVRYLNILVLA